MKKTLQLILPVIIILMMAFQAMATISGPLTVTTTATLIATKDVARMGWTITNLGATAVLLKYDDSTTTVTATNGFYLAPQASVSCGPGGGAGWAQNAIWAITSSGSTTISLQSTGQR